VIGSAEAIALVHLEGETIEGFACAHDAGFRAYLSELVVSRDVWRDAERFYRVRGWTPPAVVLLRKRLR
jgi:hypothetical protein